MQNLSPCFEIILSFWNHIFWSHGSNRYNFLSVYQNDIWLFILTLTSSVAWLKNFIILQKETLNIVLVTKNTHIDCNFNPKSFLHLLKEKYHDLLILLLLILLEFTLLKSNKLPLWISILEYHKWLFPEISWYYLLLI